MVAYGALLQRRAARGARQRLGQPAFLAVARVAGRRSGAGGDRRGRFGDGRDDVPDRTQPGLGTGIRGGHRDDPRPPTPPGICLGRLSVSGAALLESTLDGIADGILTAVPQPADGVTVAPKITVDEARIRWELPAHVVERRIRAVTPQAGGLDHDRRSAVQAGAGHGPRRRTGSLGAGRDSCHPRRCSGGHRVATGDPRPDPAAGQETDDRRRLGARCPARRDGDRAQ